jgi:CRISPR/Cas system-associated protein endoribonuclease Cas2
LPIFQFKPGYSYYCLTQQIDLTANSFQFVSSEENGNAGGTGSTLFNHIDCNYGSTQCDYSMSYIVTQDKCVIQWLTTAGTYRYIPCNCLILNLINIEHHLISFHITDTTVIPCLANAKFSIIADTLNPGVYNAYETSTGNGVLSYLWDFGDGTSSTLQYPNHQYAIPGQYVVCLTVTSAIGTNTCSDTYCDSSSVQKMAAGFLMSQFNVIAPIVTNINETEKSIEIKAYPNPISDELVIEFTHKDFERLNYELIDAIGRVVLSNSFEKGKTTINTSQLSKGFYNLNIINADGNKIKSLKIIK